MVATAVSRGVPDRSWVEAPAPRLTASDSLLGTSSITPSVPLLQVMTLVSQCMFPRTRLLVLPRIPDRRGVEARAWFQAQAGAFVMLVM